MHLNLWLSQSGWSTSDIFFCREMVRFHQSAITLNTYIVEAPLMLSELPWPFKALDYARPLKIWQQMLQVRWVCYWRLHESGLFWHIPQTIDRIGIKGVLCGGSTSRAQDIPEQFPSRGLKLKPDDQCYSLHLSVLLVLWLIGVNCISLGYVKTSF